VWTGEFDEAGRWLQRASRALETDTAPGIRLLLHIGTGMLLACRPGLQEALAEFTAAEHLQERLDGPHALENHAIGWKIATQARLGLRDEARASLGALDDQRANAGEIRNAHAVVCLMDGAPGQALDHLKTVLEGVAPVIGYVTVVESWVLAAHAHRDLGDQRAAIVAVERALALSEPDRLVLPFAMSGSSNLLESMPRHQTAHAGLLTDILDALHGSSLPRQGESSANVEQLSPSELKVLRYLPTNLSRLEIASELSVSVNTVNTHIRNIYAKLGAQDRTSAVQRARELRLVSAGLAGS
jgi:LuxR family maltose regulon positive regulatory protein